MIFPKLVVLEPQAPASYLREVRPAEGEVCPLGRTICAKEMFGQCKYLRGDWENEERPDLIGTEHGGYAPLSEAWAECGYPF